MLDTVLPFALVALGLGCLGLGFLFHRRRATSDGTAERYRAESATRDRMLGLLAQDLQARGVALLGLAAELPPGRGTGVESEARHILRLSDDLSDWRAAHAGPRVLRLEAVTLKPLVEEAVAIVSSQLSPGRRQWRIAPDLDPLVVRADRRALRGALLQVLTRAVRLTREGDWINLRPVLTAESLSLVIEDDGHGLGAEDLAHVQVGGTVSDQGRTRDLGFGLAIARSLMEAHGGGLRLEAVRDIGARAWLMLPRERLLAGA